MPLLQRLCWPCIAVGSTTYFLAAAAIAADAAQGRSLDWRDLALAAIALVAALIGAYVKGQQSRLDTLENKFTQLNNTILQHHPNRDGVKEAIAAANATVDLRLCSVERAVRAVHRRLDTLRIPAVHNGLYEPPDDGN
jgi:hypothetical protein